MRVLGKMGDVGQTNKMIVRCYARALGVEKIERE